MTVDTAPLKELAEAATPGPWDTDTVHNEGDYGNGEDCHTGFDSYQITAPSSNGRVVICDTLNSDIGCVEEEFYDDVHNAWDAVAKANAAFIASARTAVPALITEIETLRAAVDALTVERDEAKVRQVDWQEGCPARPYGEAWFLAVMASGDRVVLRELPEEYAYDFKTADDTYVKRENVNRWAQFPDSEFLFPREKLAAAESALIAVRAERDEARDHATRLLHALDPLGDTEEGSLVDLAEALAKRCGAAESALTTARAERDALREVLIRISKFTPARSNAGSARDLHITVRAIADTALEKTK